MGWETRTPAARAPRKVRVGVRERCTSLNRTYLNFWGGEERDELFLIDLRPNGRCGARHSNIDKMLSGFSFRPSHAD
jgi:hypothetical protein